MTKNSWTVLNYDENYDEAVEINHKPNWPFIHDHLYKILIICGLESGKSNKTSTNRY